VRCVAAIRNRGLSACGSETDSREMIAVVLGADRLQQAGWGTLPPALHHVERLVEGVGILDLHPNFQPLAVGVSL